MIFIGILILALSIMWIRYLVFNDRIDIHPSIENPLQSQYIWAHDIESGEWVYGYFYALTDYDYYLVSEGKLYSWDHIDYWVDLNEYKG